MSLQWHIQKRKGGGDGIQLYHMENCIAARELQTHRADLKNHGDEAWVADQNANYSVNYYGIVI